MAAAPPRTSRRPLTMMIAAALIASLLPGMGAQANEGPDADGSTQIVTGKQIVPKQLPAAPDSPSARATANARVTASRDHPKPGSSSSENGLRFDRRSEARVSGSVDSATPTGQREVTAVPGSFNATNYLPILSGNHFAANATGAMIGSQLLLAAQTTIRAMTTTIGNEWEVATFFAIPGDEFYWGSAVSASIHRGRFVAVSPSFDGPDGGCANGWLNVAVSSSSDPLKPWTRFRISLPDAWTDLVRIGVSDDKVVFTSNQWDLDAGQGDCLGGAYEGSRVRVVDWADLTDGGTLTVRDLTPSPATSYYGWIPSQQRPGDSLDGCRDHRPSGRRSLRG